MFKRYRILLISALISLISGCGGDDAEHSYEQPDEKEKIAVYASDVLQFVSIGSGRNIIDLHDKTKSEDGSPLIISDVSPLNNNDSCQVIDINGLSFTVSASSLGSCTYKYKVKSVEKDKEGASEAIANIATTSDPTKGEYLAPISEVIEMSTDAEEKKLTLNLTLMSLPEGFNLMEESLLLLGDEVIADNPGSVTYQSPNTIVYKAPQQEGTVRIYYSAMNDQGDVRPGIIFIAVGQLSNNHNPTARNEYLMSEDGGDFYTSTKKKYLIDLEKKGLVKDDDGDSLQIVGLSSINNIIEFIPEEPLKFYYTPLIYGKAEIQYTVTDHNGGYAMGILSTSNKEYKDIEYNDEIFSGPMTMSEVEAIGGAVSGVHSGDGVSGESGHLYPSFTSALAESYCQIRGFSTVANSEDLTEVWNNVLDKKNVFLSEYKWHAGLPYWGYSNKDSTYYLMSLYDGKQYTSKDFPKGYFSCKSSAIINSVVVLPASVAMDWNETRTFSLLDKDKGEVLHRTKWTAISDDMPDGASYKMNGETLIVSASEEVAESGTSEAHITVIGEDLGSGLSSESIVHVGFGQCPESLTWQETLTSSCVHIQTTGSGDVLYTLPPSRTSIEFLSDEMVSLEQITYVGSPVAVPRIKRKNIYFEKLFNSYCNALNNVKFGDRNNWEAFPITDDARAAKIVDELNGNLATWLDIRSYFLKIMSGNDADLVMPEKKPGSSRSVYIGGVDGVRKWKTSTPLLISRGSYGDFICSSAKP
ncbi:hypothetical protein [Photobacterium damselae]|uniref:hypothetical protein n=1 Tax=Photobacterium damselae TaxID=38293 RepID=UPI001F2870B0|nr:hypothetical protein [Photobacterium damselae]UKA31638.1 hypothetical protein IPQ37_17465 [Photobacterium damselae subsp. damselae]